MDIMTTRRGILAMLGASVAIGSAGCSNLSQENPADDATDSTTTSESTSEPETPEETEQPEDEQGPQEETQTLPETGTFNFQAEDGGIGPGGFFDQGNITLETYVQRENGGEEYLTTQGLRKKNTSTK
jgi:hypothetical protein